MEVWMTMILKVLELGDDLEKLVDDINSALWDEANEMPKYDVESLHAYLERADTLFLTCYRVESDQSTLLGMASSRIEIKPYDHELWLYVDEVDVCSDQRQKGAGKAIMSKLIEIAKDKGCEEVWLGTEVDNLPANALYRLLDPDDVANVVGYTFETDE
jgi:ribosomal protein S18 acetylase RimI-like enzyme